MASRSSLLADLVDRRRDAILAAWCERVARDIAPRSLGADALRDNLPKVIDALVTVLRGASPLDATPPAREHGAQRRRLGFDSEAIAREFDTLADCIVGERLIAGVIPTRDDEASVGSFFARAAIASTHTHADLALREARAEAEVERFVEAATESDRPGRDTVARILGDLFDGAPAFVALLRGPQHVFALANANYREVVGRDVVGRRVLDILPEVEGQGLVSILDHVYQTGQAFNAREMPVWLTHHDARREYFFTFVYQAVRDEGGAIAGIGVFGFDATESVLARRRAEDLARQREFAFDVVERGEPLVVLDAAWTIVLVNPSYATLTKRPREALVGHDFWEVFPEVAHEGSEHRRAFHLARDERETVRTEVYYEPLDLWTQLSVFPTREGGVAVFVRDTSAAKRSEAARAALADRIALQRAELEAIFTSLPDAVYVGDATGIKRTNRAAREMLGRLDATNLDHDHDLGAVAGTLEVRDLVTNEPVPLDQVAFARALAGETVTLEQRVRNRTTGAEMVVRSAAAPIRMKDAIVGAVTVNTDVTAVRQALEREKASRREADQANRLKDEFLAVVSHELRTPLNAMLGWTNMLRAGNLEPSLEPRALETIERNARSQAQLVEDLLDISRIISGQLRLTSAPVDMHAVVERALDVVRPAATAKGVRLIAVLDPDAGPIVGDAERLQQIAWNLLSNAVKFTPKGGKVGVELTRVESSVELRVNDTGQGIDPAFLPYVFERFRQAEGGPTRSQGGLGLGLAIVKNLVELHGGTVAVSSEGEGKGTSFRVLLPVSALRRASLDPPGGPQSGVAPPALQLECPQQLAGLRVLVVDDEPDARELLVAILTHCQIEVKAASNVANAITLVRSWRPAVVISDIGMPGEDGYALVRRLHELPRDEGGMTPAIALTAYARAEDRTRALLAGFAMHLPKPVEPAELLLVLSAVADRLGRTSRPNEPVD